jgi:hypothetical protein
MYDLKTTFHFLCMIEPDYSIYHRKDFMGYMALAQKC